MSFSWNKTWRNYKFSWKSCDRTTRLYQGHWGWSAILNNNAHHNTWLYTQLLRHSEDLFNHRLTCSGLPVTCARYLVVKSFSVQKTCWSNQLLNPPRLEWSICYFVLSTWFCISFSISITSVLLIIFFV